MNRETKTHRTAKPWIWSAPLVVVVIIIVAMRFMGGHSVHDESSKTMVGGATNPVPAAVGQNAAATQITGSNSGSAAPVGAPINPYAGALREPGKSKRAWEVSFLKTHQHATAGDAIEFELTEGRIAKGLVKITQYRNGELSYISGELNEPEAGEFFFLTPPQLGVAGRAVGVVQLPASQTAYRIEPTGPGGEPELWQRRLDEVICVGMPEPIATTANAAVNTNESIEITPLRPDDLPTYIPSYNSNIVSLQSLPGARGVLLLDFAGGYTPTWGGVYYVKPAAANNNTIRDVWKRVAEDYMPFNINVTTDIKVYLQAPETSRQRVAFTDTPVTGAGVAYYGSWNWGGDTPCWSVYSTGKNAGEVASHEAGHTLNLSHQGQWDGVNTTNEYYGGQGSGETGWAPIMGVGYYQPVAQWAKGEYNAANQFEDELARIVGNNNDVDYRTDDTGSVLANARYLEVHEDDSVSAEGIIEQANDVDAFQFTTTGGAVVLTARPVADWANLGLAVVLANSADVVISSNNPQNTLWANINTTLAAGTYTFRVVGVGKNNPVFNGFSAYASLGYFSIVGRVTGARQPTRLSVFEHVANGTVVGTVPPHTSGNLSYAIVSGNTGGTFAINNGGVLFVANNALLDYDQRATNSAYMTGFELFVNILNLDDPGQNELNRRVIVNLLNSEVGQPVAVTGFNAGIMVPNNATTAAPQATGFDIPNNWAFYQAGLNGNPQINSSGQGLQGLPIDRLVRSHVDGSRFELGPYGGLNALMLGNVYPASGILTLATSQAFNRLAVLASSANGGGLGTMVLNFANGAHSAPISLNAQDWYGTTDNVAVQGYGRVRLGQATFSTENPGWNNPNIYQTSVDLASLGLNHAVASITFNSPPVGGNRTTAILGVSGQVMPATVAIAKQPLSATNNNPALPVTFSVVAMGDPTLGYQWYSGNPGSGTPLPGQTGTSLWLSSVQPSDAGNYYVVVTNSFSSATSQVATLVVYRAPQIVQHPAPAAATRAIGKSISYAVVANAAVPVNYYWRSNGVTIPGATAATLNLLNLQSNNAASYSVLVSNAYGTALSSSATLTIVPPNYPYAQMVLAANPIGYWRLDELSGTTAYDCVGNNNGTYNSALLGQPGYNWVDTHSAARFGYVASQNSYVGGIPIDFGSVANQSLTVEAWVRGGVPSTDAGLITKGTGSGGEQFNLDCGAGGHAYRFFVRKDDGGVVGASSNIQPNNQWQHVVGVLNRTAGYVAIYVNGISNASGSFPTQNYRGLLRTSSPMTIGARQGGTAAYNFQFGGYMQDVAVYGYALSPGQILSHYNAAGNRSPGFATDPILRPTANAEQVYAAAINTEASDPNGDVVIFGKVSGPAWLNVSTGGVISGIPANQDANTNTFVVSARDSGGLSNVATLKLYVNANPVFNVAPFQLPDVEVGLAAVGNIATNVTDLNTVETLSFAKVSGADWVQVATNGLISGSPTESDLGTNSVIVSVTDAGGLSSSATMVVRVISGEPLVASLLPQGNDLLLSWSGGIPPFEVQMKADLSDLNWISLGNFSTNTSLLVTPSNVARFYRIVGQ